MNDDLKITDAATFQEPGAEIKGHRSDIHYPPASLIIKDGMMFGPWRFDLDSLSLTFQKQNHDYYPVDLERCRTCSQMLDWIFQISGKNWGTPEVIGSFIIALDNLLYPQANLCSGGKSYEISRTKLKKIIKKAVEQS